MSVKLNYSLTLIHRHDYTASRRFTTTQRFTNSHALLGKTKFIPVAELMDVGCGFLSDSASNAIVELQMNKAVTYLEKSVDICAASRTRKNASGVYFDTSTFQLADQRWYIRFYVNKVNANGLPAIYLYLADKTKSVIVELQFTLCLAGDLTEILTYSFGDCAKYEGFGKTLRERLPDVDRLTEVTVGVEVQSVMVYKLVSVKLPRQLQTTRHHQRDNRLTFLPHTSSSPALNNSLHSAADSFLVRYFVFVCSTL